jgi:hypothetical protein
MALGQQRSALDFRGRSITGCIFQDSIPAKRVGDRTEPTQLDPKQVNKLCRVFHRLVVSHLSADFTIPDPELARMVTRTLRPKNPRTSLGRGFTNVLAHV